MAKIWEPQSKEVYNSWIEAIMSEASDKLSDWESSFIASIEGRLIHQNLTQSQAEKLEQIYVKYTE